MPPKMPAEPHHPSKNAGKTPFLGLFAGWNQSWRHRSTTFRVGGPVVSHESAPSSRSELEVPIDQVMLLEPAESLADLPGPHGADAVDRFEVAMARAHHRVEALEVAHDVPDDGVRKSRDAREHAIAPRLHRVVERVRVAGVAEQL